MSEPRQTLEGCICGQCFECPDGWHYAKRDTPCLCTPDCRLGELAAAGVDSWEELPVELI